MATALSFPTITGVTGAPYISALGDAANIQDTINYLYYGSTKTAQVTDGIYGALYKLYVGDPTLAGNVTITGNLTVNGTTTTINSTTISVDDANIELGSVATPTDITANGGGITLRGATNKTIIWDNVNSAWTTSEHWNLAANKQLRINNLAILDTNPPKSMATLMGYTSTATAAGTTTLTNTSSYYQQFTGTSTQTVVLPVTSTLITGWTFHIVNNSTGNLTVNSSGGNFVITVVPGTTAMLTCVNTAVTTAAGWESGLTDFSTYTGTGGDVVLSNSPVLVNPALYTAAGNITLSPSTGGSITLTVPNNGVNDTLALQSDVVSTAFFGDGSDGNVTISSGATTLSRDMFYNNLTISGTGVLITNGYRVFVKGIFDVSAAQASAIVDNSVTGAAAAGSNASGQSQGAGGTVTVGGPLSPSPGSAGATGGQSSSAGGASGTAIANTTSVFPDAVYLGAVGGTGGTATGAGGSGGTQTSPTLTFGARRAWIDWTPLAAGKLFTNAGGTGGGSGGGSVSFPSSLSGAGGGGGAGARPFVLYAKTINRSSSTGTGFINLVGGAGGTGGAASSSGAGHGHGGGGGQGGFVYIVYANLTGTAKTGAIVSKGGNGGAPGGSGAGTPGSQGGANGAVFLLNITTGSYTYTAPTIGTTGTSTSGGTGNSVSVTL